ncbi:MAG: hypothetical protein LBU35_03415 [Holosporales bacterium]|nr:hypothetical protein [Holosporales bacterium]
MNFIRILTLAFSVNYCIAAEESAIIPGDGEDIEQIFELIEGYTPSYLKYEGVGYFMNDEGLYYTIPKEVITSKSFERYKLINGKTALGMLLELSENQWIALNKRELKNAAILAEEMKQISLGKFGLRTIKIPSEKIHRNLMEIKLRTISQIDMLNIKSDANIPIESLTARENYREFNAIFSVVSHYTNTPLLSQSVSKDIRGETIPKEERIILDGVEQTVNHIVSQIKGDYADKGSLIDEVIEIKKAAYKRYLNYVYAIMRIEDIRQYRMVDKGQTSDGHWNTCLFNSTLYLDKSLGNIETTKCGFLEKTKGYLNSLIAKFRRFNPRGSFIEERIIANVEKMKADRGAEALYSCAAWLEDDKICPGIIGDGSVLETGCHGLCLNFAIFPNQKVREGGNRLRNYYGCGYYGSEDFGIAGVSCSTGHAQALERI